jgi:hypothetical protein
MILVVLGLKFFIGQNLTILLRLIIFITVGAGAYLISLRLIRPGLFTEIIELAQMAMPKFLTRNE